MRQAKIAHANETTHYRATERRWLWTLVTPLAVYLLTHYSRGKAAARALLGDFAGVLVTDHYAGYNDDDRSRRQLCWAYLIRRLERIAERRGQAGQTGRRMQRLRAAMHAQLEQGQAASRCKRTAKQCQYLLKDEALYWAFLGNPRIPLTNNTAERAIRPYVLWRKISFASQSHRGAQFRPLVLLCQSGESRVN